MGEVEVFTATKEVVISSNVLTYGYNASAALTQEIEAEIESMWNEPQGNILLQGDRFRLIFKIKAYYFPRLIAQDIVQNTNPKNNYFRIEPYCNINISFVDALGSNTGYWLIDNLYKGSTTAAHEYGHTLGLEHPIDMDLRGQGVPGIMYPRGTLVDPQYQYNPEVVAGEKGGTMHPMYRRVKQKDIDLLQIPRLNFNGNKAIIGAYSNIYHEAHIQ
jgi:hypothetical protein